MHGDLLPPNFALHHTDLCLSPEMFSKKCVCSTEQHLSQQHPPTLMRQKPPFSPLLPTELRSSLEETLAPRSLPSRAVFAHIDASSPSVAQESTGLPWIKLVPGTRMMLEQTGANSSAHASAHVLVFQGEM